MGGLDPSEEGIVIEGEELDSRMDSLGCYFRLAKPAWQKWLVGPAVVLAGDKTGDTYRESHMSVTSERSRFAPHSQHSW